MKFLFVFQFILLMCALRSVSTSEMWLPRLHPIIQPIWVNKTWDEDTKVSNYYMRFRGPPDTKEELGVISLGEVEKGDLFSLFESHVQVPFGNNMIISLKSASTSETFKMSIVGDAKSGSQVRFPGQFCEFDMMGETNEQYTAYWAFRHELCDSNPKDDFDIFVYFEVNLRKDNQSYLYRGMKEEDNFNFTKYVEDIDEKDVNSLFIYDENVQADDIQLDTPFIWILVMKYLPTEQDIVTVYGWKMQVM